MEGFLGWLFAPVAWVIGIPWAEAAQGGSLIGQKLVLNEFVAYGQFAEWKEGMSDRTQAISAVALISALLAVIAACLATIAWILAGGYWRWIAYGWVIPFLAIVLAEATAYYSMAEDNVEIIQRCSPSLTPVALETIRESPTRKLSGRMRAAIDSSVPTISRPLIDTTSSRPSKSSACKQLATLPKPAFAAY